MFVKLADILDRILFGTTTVTTIITPIPYPNDNTVVQSTQKLGLVTDNFSPPPKER